MNIKISSDMCPDIAREPFFQGLHKMSPSRNKSEPAGECLGVTIWIPTHLCLPVTY